MGTQRLKGQSRDICYVKDRNKHLVVATHDWKAVSAYDVASGELEWTVKGKLPE